MKKIGQILSTIVSYSLRSIVKLWNKFLELFKSEYEIIIWFSKDSEYYNKSVAYEKFNFKRVDKLTSRHIKGVLTSGHKYEIRTKEEFNYKIKKVK